jgi:hypothetical protein
MFGKAFADMLIPAPAAAKVDFLMNLLLENELLVIFDVFTTKITIWMYQIEEY